MGKVGKVGRGEGIGGKEAYRVGMWVEGYDPVYGDGVEGVVRWHDWLYEEF